MLIFQFFANFFHCIWVNECNSYACQISSILIYSSLLKWDQNDVEMLILVKVIIFVIEELYSIRRQALEYL